MSQPTYYQSASAFVAFDAFMVVAFTVTMLGFARAIPHHFVRLLSAIWLVYVVRVVERAFYLTLSDRTSLWASLLAGTFAATGFLPVLLVRQVASTDLTQHGVWPRRLWLVGLSAFVGGAAVHFATTFLTAAGFELAAAFWSRLYVGIPLALMMAATFPRKSPHVPVHPLYWGFVAQAAFMLIDAVVRYRSFTVGLTSWDSGIAASMTIASTLAIGIASLLAVLEHERLSVADRAARIRVAQERAAESERWQQVGQLARGVAHDFNNVLGVIVSGSDLVEDSIRTSAAEVDADLSEIDHAVERGRSLTQRLLRFARHQPMQPRNVQVGQIGRELLPMLRRLVSRDRNFSLDCTDELAVRIDPTAVEQILLNLVVNARDATMDGGRVAVRVADVSLQSHAPAVVGALGPGTYVRVSVEDNGCGMSDAVQRKLWEPFFTTKGERGSGIGLPTVAAAAVEAGGAIVVESEVGAGSRFHVWLPAATSAATAA
jgi:signal transduction histidine kinase